MIGQNPDCGNSGSRSNPISSIETSWRGNPRFGLSCRLYLRRGLTFFIERAEREKDKPTVEVKLLDPFELTQDQIMAGGLQLISRMKMQTAVITARNNSIEGLTPFVQIDSGEKMKLTWYSLNETMELPMAVIKKDSPVELIAGSRKVRMDKPHMDFVKDEPAPLVLWSLWETRRGDVIFEWNTGTGFGQRLADYEGKNFPIHISFSAKNDLSDKTVFDYTFVSGSWDTIALKAA